MPIMRNPFRKPASDIYTDETLPPPAAGADGANQKPHVFGSVTKPLSIRGNEQDKKPTEYQLSEINDSGVFLPPSPPDTKSSFWSSRSATSTRSSSHRSVLNENEPFNISRESFDSYRRSFDISARSPVIDASPYYGRQSLDARKLRLPASAQSPTASPRIPKQSPPSLQEEVQQLPRQVPRRPSVSPYQGKILAALPDGHINPPAAEPDESEDAQVPVGKDQSNAAHAPGDRFEDVGLGDDTQPSKRLPHHPHQQIYHPSAKKPGIFSRITGNASAESGAPTPESSGRPGSSGIGIGLGMGSHGFFGRKRGGSGQGAELGSLYGKAPMAASQEVKVDH